MSRQIPKAGHGVEAIEFLVAGNEGQGHGSVSIRLFEQRQGLLFVTETDINLGKVIGRHVTPFRPAFQPS